MSTSTQEGIFGLPEIIEHLALFLSQADISCLARTCRACYWALIPSFYRSITTTAGENGDRLFTSLSALTALGKYIHHARELNIRVAELFFYYKCVLAHEGAVSPQVPPIFLTKNPTCPLVALSPFTRLTVLNVTFSKTCITPFSIFNIKNHQVMLKHVCWLINLNPNLVDLSINNLQIINLLGGQFLSGAIASLSRIKRLHLNVHYRRLNWFELLSQLFFNCPQSIQHLTLNFSWRMTNAPMSTSNILSEEYYGEVTAVPPRQEPLMNLEELLIDIIRDWQSIEEIHSIFVHCPNLKKLGLSSVYPPDGNDSIGKIIAESCPKIESICFGMLGTSIPEALPLSLMKVLPAQQVHELNFFGRVAFGNVPKFKAAVLQHSTALRRIKLDTNCRLQVTALSPIFQECRHLETLHIAVHLQSGHFVALHDLNFPWICTQLRELQLGISGCSFNTRATSVPYYVRPVPIILTPSEIEHFALLENLYRQIGALTELKLLNLSMIHISNRRTSPPGRMGIGPGFPAFLSLGSTSTGRPGYLHHLVGLKKLEYMYGSVSANSPETKITMGWDEARWMDQNWPRLRRIALYNANETASRPFQWLRKKRMDNNQILEIHVDDL